MTHPTIQLGWPLNAHCSAQSWGTAYANLGRHSFGVSLCLRVTMSGSTTVYELQCRNVRYALQRFSSYGDTDSYPIVAHLNVRRFGWILSIPAGVACVVEKHGKFVGGT